MADPVYDTAACELGRLLKRLGIRVDTQAAAADGDWLRLAVTSPGVSGMPASFDETPRDDGYVVDVTPGRVTLLACSGKGVLNAVYDLAERLGFLFLLPGESGEWPPTGGPAALPSGREVCNPRFRHRGVFWQSLRTVDYSTEDWLRFYAKLRFNAVLHDLADAQLCSQFGLRLEVGGHGLSSFLPRDRFGEHPEWFRLIQPEDFNGRRMEDSNLCVSDPGARAELRRNFREWLSVNNQAYAIHVWADDLPAGGWCLCPGCRSLTPSDQSTLALRHLAGVVREVAPGSRMANIAYHDTLQAPRTIRPPAESFLLFAPRERCYGHALDDPSCARNRLFLQALKDWMTAYAGIDDAHTFEYYFDQILFRGMYPFVPDVILGDMAVYEQVGIETHMSLQVAGPAVAPEFNMLLFSRAHWDRGLTAPAFIDWLARRISLERPDRWRQYLAARGRLFEDALRMCDHPLDIYLDYRWLPLSDAPFGRELAGAYETSAQALGAAADSLAADPPCGGREAALIHREIARARFESCELRVMATQQAAMNARGTALNSDRPENMRDAIVMLEKARGLLPKASEAAAAAGIDAESWYARNINGWLAREWRQTLGQWRQF